MTHNTYPLVSILIPTYNRPHYFRLALDSALAQTYPHIEIIIGDDSTDSTTEEIVRQFYLPEYKNITYIRNPSSLGQFQNDLMLLERAAGDYINFLMDDDLFHPDKIQKMMKFFLREKSTVSIVTSFRKLIDGEGNHLPDNLINRKLCEMTAEIAGMDVGNRILVENHNYIGEPTTALFKKQYLTEPFGTLDGREYKCCVDMASWIHLVSKGSVVYISEPLSSFRLHSGQQLQSHMKQLEGTEDLLHLITISREYGFLQNNIEYQQALQKLMQVILYCYQHYSGRMTETINLRLVQCVAAVSAEMERAKD